MLTGLRSDNQHCSSELSWCWAPFHLRTVDRFYYGDNKGQVNDLCEVAAESAQVTENHFLSSWSLESEEHRQLTVCCYILSESFQFPLHGNYPTQLQFSGIQPFSRATLQSESRQDCWPCVNSKIRKFHGKRKTFGIFMPFLKYPFSLKGATHQKLLSTSFSDNGPFQVTFVFFEHFHDLTLLE